MTETTINPSGFDEALLPKAARELITAARQAGWSTLIDPGEDSGGAAFVKVEVGLRSPRYHYMLTWHTRDTGTYRLYGQPLAWTHDRPRRGWHEVPGVRHIREVIAANPAPTRG